MSLNEVVGGNFTDQPLTGKILTTDAKNTDTYFIVFYVHKL